MDPRAMKVHVGRRDRLAIGIAGCGALAVAVSGLAQEAGQPTFRTGVELVQVAVVVTDKSGQAVTNLSAEDFALTEEDHPQRIVAFERIDVPHRDAGTAPLAAPSDVATNAGAADARLFVLLLDDLHIDPQHTSQVRRLARQFVEQFTSDADLVMVIPTGGDTGLVRDFTTDRARVLETIDKFMGRRRREFRSGLEEAQLARGALDVIERLAGHLASADRRVAVVLVTEGFPLQAAASTEITHAVSRTVAAMQNSNCVLYLVDPRGLSTERTDLLDDLRGLALDTGGFAAIAVNRFDETFDRIARENSSYYVLGFYPAPGGRPGQTRDIEVKVPGRDVRVHSRRAFVVSKPPSEAHDIDGLTSDLARVLRSPVPVSDLPMRVQAVPFRDGGQTRVLVVLEIRGDKVDIPSSQRIAIATTTIDSRGRASNGTMTPIELSLSDEEQQRARLTGFRWVTTLPLRSGTHQQGRQIVSMVARHRLRLRWHCLGLRCRRVRLDHS